MWGWKWKTICIYTWLYTTFLADRQNNTPYILCIRYSIYGVYMWYTAVYFILTQKYRRQGGLTACSLVLLEGRMNRVLVVAHSCTTLDLSLSRSLLLTHTLTHTPYVLRSGYPKPARVPPASLQQICWGPFAWACKHMGVMVCCKGPRLIICRYNYRVVLLSMAA